MKNLGLKNLPAGEHARFGECKKVLHPFPTTCPMHCFYLGFFFLIITFYSKRVSKIFLSSLNHFSKLLELEEKEMGILGLYLLNETYRNLDWYLTTKRMGLEIQNISDRSER